MEDQQREKVEEMKTIAWQGLACGFLASAKRADQLPLRHEPKFDVTVHSPECDHHLTVTISATMKQKSPSTLPSVMAVHIEDQDGNIAKSGASFEWNSGESFPTIVDIQFFPNALIGLHSIESMINLINEAGGRLEQPGEFE